MGSFVFPRCGTFGDSQRPDKTSAVVAFLIAGLPVQVIERAIAEARRVAQKTEEATVLEKRAAVLEGWTDGEEAPSKQAAP